MKPTDDSHSDHDLKAYLDGRDGLSAAYRKTAHDEPPAALDQFILNAARESQSAPAAAPRWYARRPPLALAASVMIAVAGLSLYVGEPERGIDANEAAIPQRTEVVEVRQLERAEAAPRDQDEPTPAAAPVREDFVTRQLPPPQPTVGVANAPTAPPTEATVRNEALAVIIAEPAVVIDGALLESIEAEAEAARTRQQEGAQAALAEIQVTGSRIVRRDVAIDDEFAYRASRETWLEELRNIARDRDRSARLEIARRSTALVEAHLEEEIELFLAEYPDTDIEAELEYEPEE